MCKVCISIGHSIYKDGRISSADGTKYGGVNEYKFNKKLAPILKKKLKDKNIDAVILKIPEKTITNSAFEKPYKINWLKNKQFDALIELHLNASDNTKAQGCECLYYSKNGRVLADKIQKQLSKLFKDRGIKYRNLYILRDTKPTACVIESFFCTNKIESAVDMDKLAEHIAIGISNFFKK